MAVCGVVGCYCMVGDGECVVVYWWLYCWCWVVVCVIVVGTDGGVDNVDDVDVDIDDVAGVVVDTVYGVVRISIWLVWSDI